MGAPIEPQEREGREQVVSCPWQVALALACLGPVECWLSAGRFSSRGLQTPLTTLLRQGWRTILACVRLGASFPRRLCPLLFSRLCHVVPSVRSFKRPKRDFLLSLPKSLERSSHSESARAVELSAVDILLFSRHCVEVCSWQ